MALGSVQLGLNPHTTCSKASLSQLMAFGHNMQSEHCSFQFFVSCSATVQLCKSPAFPSWDVFHVGSSLTLAFRLKDLSGKDWGKVWFLCLSSLSRPVCGWAQSWGPCEAKDSWYFCWFYWAWSVVLAEHCPSRASSSPEILFFPEFLTQDLTHLKKFLPKLNSVLGNSRVCTWLLAETIFFFFQKWEYHNKKNYAENIFNSWIITFIIRFFTYN